MLLHAMMRFFSLRLSDSMDGDDDAVVHPCKTVIQQPTNCLLSPKSSSSGEEEWWHEQNSARDLITMRRALLFRSKLYFFSLVVGVVVVLDSPSLPWSLNYGAAGCCFAQVGISQSCTMCDWACMSSTQIFASLYQRKGAQKFFFSMTLEKINWMKSQISPRYLSCRWSFHNIPKSSSTSSFFFRCLRV